MLRALDLIASLPGDDGPVRVLSGVSLHVDAGEVLDIVGPSGSGKSTLLRALARLMPGATGRLELDGADAASVSPQVWRTRVTLVPQKPAIANGCLRDNLLMPWLLKVRRAEDAPSDAALEAALDEVGLSGLSLDRDAARLSVGQQGRLALLRVTLAAPRVLLLDEADAALDADSVAAVTELTRRFAERGGAAVRVRHRESDGLARRTLRMADGALTEVGA